MKGISSWTAPSHHSPAQSTLRYVNDFPSIQSEQVAYRVHAYGLLTGEEPPNLAILLPVGPSTPHSKTPGSDRQRPHNLQRSETAPTATLKSQRHLLRLGLVESWDGRVSLDHPSRSRQEPEREPVQYELPGCEPFFVETLVDHAGSVCEISFKAHTRFMVERELPGLRLYVARHESGNVRGLIPMNACRKLSITPGPYASGSPSKYLRAVDDNLDADEKELAFRRGATIEIIGTADETCWIGQMNGIYGRVPKAKVVNPRASSKRSDQSPQQFQPREWWEELRFPKARE